MLSLYLYILYVRTHKKQAQREKNTNYFSPIFKGFLATLPRLGVSNLLIILTTAHELRYLFKRGRGGSQNLNPYTLDRTAGSHALPSGPWETPKAFNRVETLCSPDRRQAVCIANRGDPNLQTRGTKKTYKNNCAVRRSASLEPHFCSGLFYVHTEGRPPCKEPKRKYAFHSYVLRSPWHSRSQAAPSNSRPHLHPSKSA